jgi:hypothetical protein
MLSSPEMTAFSLVSERERKSQVLRGVIDVKATVPLRPSSSELVIGVPIVAIELHAAITLAVMAGNRLEMA